MTAIENITLKNIIKEFPLNNGEALRVIDDISLTITKGEIIGIIGRSGAGKSTLLRCMNLLEPPTSGNVFINDADLTQIANHKVRQFQQKMGMVFQHFNLLWNRNVEQNIQLPLEISHVKKNQWAHRVSEALDFVGLSDQAKKYPSQLSGGQKQRVGIARALALKPDFLLCDEITSALDPETTDSILDLLTSINKKTGITIVVITHEMDVIQKICHRAIILENGKIAEEGASFDLFAHPKHATTKRFIRSIFEHDLPKILQKRPSDADQTHLLRLIYSGDKANEPTLSHLIRHYGIDVNILHGRIEYIQGQALGLLWVRISLNQTSLNDIIKELQNADVHVEVI